MRIEMIGKRMTADVACIRLDDRAARKGWL
jgi:hypothetical protein